ncbi:PAS domain S-box protein [Pontibacter rufus]|uniref:PAS domain S-box protein n=1 Tax=Pontibacter rufus TaxID=2791028 RepID=UPI003CCC8050
MRYDSLIEDVQYVISSNQTVEEEVQDKNGIWYQMRILPYITQERQIDGATIIFIQINELKSLHLLHAGILDSSPNAIMALKAIRDQQEAITDFTISMVNRSGMELLGSTETSLYGNSLWKEYPSLLREGLFEQLVQVVETGVMLNVKQEIKYGKDPIWLHVVASKFDDGLVLTMQNITERKQNEQQLLLQQEEITASAARFRTMLEAVPHITWTNKQNGENNSFNEFWFKYTGLSPEESAGWGWEKAFHPADFKKLKPGYLASLQSGEVYSAEARILRKADNQYRWHLIKNVPLRDETGEIVLWVGTATDIQDQKDSEKANIKLGLSQQREIMKAILQAQEEERSRISEALHNGLGQILYAAKLNLDNLPLDKSGQKHMKEHIEQLLAQGIKITRNISYELTPSVLKEFGLKTAVEEIISMFSSPELSISSNISGFTKPVDYTTALSLYRIIQELLNNIVKHSGATEASVTLVRKKDTILLRVQDNGIGITKEEFNAKKGIGLSSIQNRVELLEGKMEIGCPGGGKGCVFEITCKV